MASIVRDKKSYHHGDLAGALVEATLSLLAVKGPALLSLREVARVAGVSHGAPAHHFGDKAGLLTAVATEGHKLLAVALTESQLGNQTEVQRLLAAGDAYIRFAASHPAHFSIMFQSDLINRQNADYIAASAVAKGVLEQSVRALAGDKAIDDRKLNATVIALWSQVHGFAKLWLAGNFGDPGDMALLDELLADMLTSITPNW